MPDPSQLLRPWSNARRWHVAFSGGLDSTVLLHLLHAYAQRHEAPPLCAVHVHHGLQAVANTWPAHCQQVCDQLGVELRVVEVEVEAGASLEQAARTARYRAFAAVLEPGDLLFTGQHLDDQAETVLFRLLRGAGLRGLTGMPQVRPLGRGQLVRPLLGHRREQLQGYAMHHGLDWIEDPSNTDTRFARNYLRAEVVPALRQRWPQAQQNLVRSAAHLSEAQGLLDELARDDLQATATQHAYAWAGVDSLSLAALTALSPARQRNALQYWLAPRTRLPDTRHWAGWETLRDAAVDAQPVWRLTDGELQRSQGRLWWLSGTWLQAPAGGIVWPDPGAALVLPGNGVLAPLPEQHIAGLRVAYRQGGEVLDVPGRGRRDLKRLLNELKVPHFLRQRLPLVWQGERLLGVANLPDLGTASLRVTWTPSNSAQGLS
ncbi:tRNA lysidine(34) synthetase TilS [Pseudomonas sp. RP23018S]|uniref:tRNA lysidine(34) synthetase TilS n=1 Tax=Pseudomonas sp. RP23018S TaxID=3096037 RepID=UPI002ACAEEB9|nr:tRNA lysidine(34) synthetase TilS [Pseudomonas sp. RP23018S]MDZ5601268.1 tRNA lysidine(34) synthetase TilS [Pseudomonas sp. RP23018S]